MKIEFILPSYNDERIVNAIQSIKNFDPTGRHTSISVYDAGSSNEVIREVEKVLRNNDRLVIERDNGVFDALNKGLDNAREEYIGWLGTDDYIVDGFNVDTILNDIKLNSEPELLSYITVMSRSGKYNRYFKPRKLSLQKIGLHNPHYSTLIKRSLVVRNRTRFDLNYHPVSDILFFQELINSKSITYSHINKVFMIMEEGGISNESSLGILKNNLVVYKSLRTIYSRYHAVLFVAVKLISKIISKFRISKYTN